MHSKIVNWGFLSTSFGALTRMSQQTFMWKVCLMLVAERGHALQFRWIMSRFFGIFLLLSNVEEMIHRHILDVLIDDGLDLDIEFGSLARNIKKEVCGVIDFILSFLTRYDEFSSYLSFKLLDKESS
jgi:hypothetical protein